MTTSAPGRQMKLRPRISGCSVRTKTPTRHSGKPALTRRSQISAIILGEPPADRAPSMSQSLMPFNSSAFMTVFAAQVPETSSHYKRFAVFTASGQSRCNQHRGHKNAGFRTGDIDRQRRNAPRAGGGRSRNPAAGAGAAHSRAALAGSGKAVHPEDDELP